LIATAGTEAADADLVARVRAGDDLAFEELYQRYFPRISAFVCRMLRDDDRCEDVAQEAFMSALRRMRATDSEITFKPWIYPIARNAAIDSYRRNSHAVEVSMDSADGLRASDRHRLVGIDGGPDSVLVTKERLSHLQGAFDELSDVHTRVLVMRELEGMSYREIGQRLDLTRPAVESALFRARRRLESEYAELSEGRRCEAMHATMVRMAAGKHRGAEEHRLARHAKRCHTCRMRARELGLDPLTTLGALRKKAAALLPIPWLLRRSDDGGTFTGLFSTGANAAPLAERAVALVAAAALVGAGGAALGGGALRGDRAASEDRAVEQPTTSGGESQRGTAGSAADGERAGARRASGRSSSGPAGGRAGGSGTSDTISGSGSGSRAPSGGSTESGSAGSTSAVPSLPGAPTTADSSVKVTVPKLPIVGEQETTTQLPEVQLPAVQVPDTGEVTSDVQTVTGDVTDTLQNTLP
jgi:RNA polymerase sigma factor (sigma-70 family)